MRIADQAGNAVGVALLCIISCQGCQAPRGPVAINSDDPDLKILAIKHDVGLNDTKDLATMVKDLDSDDPAIRFYSVQALRRLTHDDFGYCYYEDDVHRAPAVARWQHWLRQQPKPVISKAD